MPFDGFPGRLRERRLERGFSQQALADRVGVTPFAVSNWEAGRRTPRLGETVRLSHALDASLDWLLLGVPPGYDGPRLPYY